MITGSSLSKINLVNLILLEHMWTASVCAYNFTKCNPDVLYVITNYPIPSGKYPTQKLQFMNGKKMMVLNKFLAHFKFTLFAKFMQLASTDHSFTLVGNFNGQFCFFQLMSPLYTEANILSCTVHIMVMNCNYTSGN